MFNILFFFSGSKTSLRAKLQLQKNFSKIDFKNTAFHHFKFKNLFKTNSSFNSYGFDEGLQTRFQEPKTQRTLFLTNMKIISSSLIFNSSCVFQVSKFLDRIMRCSFFSVYYFKKVQEI